MRFSKVYIVVLLLVIVIAGCERFIQSDNETHISKSDEDESHFFGRNCMTCHYTHGSGEGWFTLAGSAEGNTRNAAIELYDDPSEPPVKVIEYDRLSNAYTTEAIDYKDGLIVAVRSSTGTLRYMGFKVHNGQCNLCHGVTTPQINIQW